MGCDIFAVIEVEERGKYENFAVLNLPRDIPFMKAVAWGEGGVTDDMPYPPRGIPVNCSDQVRKDFYVTRDDIVEFLKDSEASDEVDDSSIEEYVAGHGEWALQEYANSGLVPQPELTEYGWLNFTEIQANLTQADVKTEALTPQCRAVIAAMESLAETLGADKVRLVFWIGM